MNVDLEAKDPEDLFLFNEQNKEKEISNIQQYNEKIRLEPYKTEKKLFSGSILISNLVDSPIQGVGIDFCIGNDFNNMSLSRQQNQMKCFEAEIEQNQGKIQGYIYRISCKSELRPLMYLPNIGELIYFKFKLNSNILKQIEKTKYDLRYSLSRSSDFYISFMEETLILFLHIVNINDLICLTRMDIFIKK